MVVLLFSQLWKDLKKTEIIVLYQQLFQYLDLLLIMEHHLKIAHQIIKMFTKLIHLDNYQ